MPTSRKRLAPASSTPTASPVRTRRAHPLAWAHALTLVDGNARRLRVLEDGGVLVLRHA